MKRDKFFTITLLLLGTAFAAAAQDPKPVPKTAPDPSPAARPAEAIGLEDAKREAVRALDAVRAQEFDLEEMKAEIEARVKADTDFQYIRPELAMQIEDARRMAADAARDAVRAQTFEFDAHRGQLEAMKGELSARLSADLAGKAFSLTPPALLAQADMKFRLDRHDSADRAYSRGQRALESRRWDEALAAFNEVASKGGARADGALYWKAYALNKLGRRDEAQAAIAELRKTYASSRWLEDAKALELEVRQSSGQPVRPETESDEDLKLMAIAGLMQSDAERAMPLLENLLKSSQSPKLKERALFVIAQSNSPRGRQILEQVARGSAGNPDLQLKAISYLGATGRRSNTGNTNNNALLWEIYSASNDAAVKRAALSGFMMARDKDHLLQVARTEKSADLRREAIDMLGANAAQAELWQLYQAETTVEVKQQILQSMIAGGNIDRLAEVARTEKDPKLRRSAIRALGSRKVAQSSDTLIGLYATESDPAVKNSIVDALYANGNAKGLVDLARKESNPGMKREIVSRLSNMKSKEAADYLMELLK